MLALRRALGSESVDIVNSHGSTDSWLAAAGLPRRLARQARPPALGAHPPRLAPVPRGAATRWLYTRATAEIVTTGRGDPPAADPRQRGIAGPGHSIPTGIDLEQFTPGDKMAARAGAAAAGGRAAGRHRRHTAQLEGPSLPGRGADAVAGASASSSSSATARKRDALQAQVRATRPRRRVRLAGEQEDVAPWLRALDVFALPSYAIRGRAAGAAAGDGCRASPCVTTDAGAIGEIAIRDATALVVAKQNAVALAAGIERLLDATRRCGSGSAGRRASARTPGSASRRCSMRWRRCFGARPMATGTAEPGGRLAGRARVVARALLSRALASGGRRSRPARSASGS